MYLKLNKAWYKFRNIFRKIYALIFSATLPEKNYSLPDSSKIEFSYSTACLVEGNQENLSSLSFIISLFQTPVMQGATSPAQPRPACPAWWGPSSPSGARPPAGPVLQTQAQTVQDQEVCPPVRPATVLTTPLQAWLSYSHPTILHSYQATQDATGQYRGRREVAY